ncbi:MAG: transglutaminase family protein [Burkholderiaceae bacterium]|jgi:transglutaminase-like putative cysteine protease|nr:transglutaminase family protein [Burkholderiaceae bacterium]MDH5207873.1 transglutaminase family protein [Burkholderiaceae bacterium]
MRLSILHRTTYRYGSPVFYSIQHLRLTPRDEPHQRTLRWRLKAPGKLNAAPDAYGNLVHTLVLTEAHGDVEIEARGEVEVDALDEGKLEETEGTTPPMTYLAGTPLTAPDDALRAFTGGALRGTDRRALLDFATAVCDAIDYQTGTTEVTSTAAEALRQGRGVCQDHAHVFIAGCRLRGLPARYVSGYVHPGDAPHAASHAWADVYLPGEGWVSIDITHRRFASDHLCRLAVGRDYVSASPVRGVRVGGGDETMQVRVNIRPFPFHADPE